MVLGAVIEAASGEPYEQFIREQILAPLGLEDTGFDVPPALAARGARGLHEPGR